jgi:hypothetical protein
VRNRRLRVRFPCRPEAGDEQFLLRQGTVEFSGLCFFSVEPAVCRAAPGGNASMWITADGALPDERLPISGIVPGDLPAGAFVHYLYSGSTNSFIVVGAMSALFCRKHKAAQIG